MSAALPVIEKAEPANELAVLEVQHLFKAFGENHVLSDFNLSLQKGESIAVLGKSGSGKSVLIKCIIGLIRPDSGNIRILGKNVPELTSAELEELRTRVGFLFQSNALYDSMSVRENLQFPLRRHKQKYSKTEEENLIKEALSNVGLLHTLDMQPSELSGGMRKRIALARTLILKPEIILYDEPTTGLDPITGKEISLLMKDLARKYQTSAILISHDLSCVKIAADKIVMLIDGTCYAEGTYEALKHSEDPKIKIFFE